MKTSTRFCKLAKAQSEVSYCNRKSDRKAYNKASRQAAKREIREEGGR